MVVFRRIGIVIFRQQTRDRIAGEIRRKQRGGGAGASANSVGTGGIGLSEFREAVAKARDVKLIDGKRAVTTLRAPGTADEPGAAAAGGVGKGGVDDLDELGVSFCHAGRVAFAITKPKRKVLRASTKALWMTTKTERESIRRRCAPGSVDHLSTASKDGALVKP
jgi:hypothetical protein